MATKDDVSHAYSEGKRVGYAEGMKNAMYSLGYDEGETLPERIKSDALVSRFLLLFDALVMREVSKEQACKTTGMVFSGTKPEVQP